MGWEQGLARFTTKEDNKAKAWLFETTPDIKDGDIVEIMKANGIVTFKINGKETHISKDKHILRLVFEPWIGKHPISKNMKK